MTPALTRSRWTQLFFQAAPIVFLVLLFHKGLDCWFIADDFAWLGLIRHVDGPRDLLRVLFEPAAQGTIRPWSERGFFLLFESLFGIDPLPFHLMTFATMAADLLLLNWITRRITGSPLAGFIAGLCWAANTALMTVTTWASAYNQAMCPLFLLTALALLMRFAETGKRKFWWWQLAVFSLGFGALEINVVYPAIAAAWVLFAGPREKRRPLLMSLAPLFVMSAAYFFLHHAVAPFPPTGAYVVRVDSRMFRALLMYGKWSLLPVNWVGFGHSAAVGKCIVSLILAAILALFISEARRRRTTVLFFLAWYLATLAPVLVLPEHHSDYYLTIPVIGLGMLFGFGVTCGSRDAGKWRWLSLVPVAAYLTGMIPISLSATQWSFNKTVAVRGLVLGVQAAREKHPGKTILLDGVSRSLYEDSIGQGALWPLHIDNVYLTAESAPAIGSAADMADTESTVLDPDVTLHAIKNDEVVIYSVAGDHLRNITQIYEQIASSRVIGVGAPGGISAQGDRLPVRVDIGNPLCSWLLGPGWLLPESGIRWMARRATVHLRGPTTPGSKLELDGFFPAEQLNGIPRVLKVAVDGNPVGETIIRNPESSFGRLFNLPASLTGKDSIEVELEAAPVDTRGGQDYGMVFGKIAVRP